MSNLHEKTLDQKIYDIAANHIRNNIINGERIGFRQGRRQGFSKDNPNDGDSCLCAKGKLIQEGVYEVTYCNMLLKAKTSHNGVITGTREELVDHLECIFENWESSSKYATGYRNIEEGLELLAQDYNLIYKKPLEKKQSLSLDLKTIEEFIEG